MRIFVKLFAVFTALVAVPASAADWYLAETQHFNIYSKDDPEDVTEFAREMERLDEVLRIIGGVGPDDGSLPPSSKVTVFRFGQTKDMANLAGAPGSGIGGFFIPRASGSYAFVPVRENRSYSRSNQRRTDGMSLDPKGILFHEYVHYFMFQHRNAPYPAWYREGFAEIFSTLRSEDGRFVIGDAPTWRSAEIMVVDIDLKEMLAPSAKQNGETIARTYGHGWLLSSLLNFTPERRPQLSDYLMRLNKGEDRIEAAKAAFGDLDALEKEMNEYRRGAAKVLKARYMNAEEPSVSLRPLRADEEARIELMIQSKAGVDDKKAAKQLEEARALVLQYPESTPVLLAAGEVEFDNKNYAEADALAQRVLSIDPKSIDAAIYHANSAFMQAADDPAMMLEARNRFIAANNMENDHPVPLFGYYMTYLLSDEEPNSAAEAALESAFRYAPFDQQIRVTLAHMFAKQGEVDILKSLLNPLIQTGHGTRVARCLAHELELFENGDKERLLERLKPEHPAAQEDDEEEDGEEEEEDCGEEETA